MSLLGKLEACIETDIPDKKMHDMSCGSLPQVSDMTPDKVQGIQLLKGEWGKAGSIFCSNYTFDGATRIAKVLIERVDNEKLSVYLKVIDGDLLEAYKTFDYTIQTTPKGKGSIVTWTMFYEKRNENIPAPTKFLDYLRDFTKDVCAWLTYPSIEHDA